MHLEFETFQVSKRFALTISRGTTAQTTNLWVRLREDGIEGWGEASPFSVVRAGKKDASILIAELEAIAPHLTNFHPQQRQEIEEFLYDCKISSSVRAAIDMALHDWLGKRVNLPLWQLWGLQRSRIKPISVTIGISSPEAARERVRAWHELFTPEVLKVKLGSPAGIEADKAMLMAVKAEAPKAALTVDANGGWSLEAACQMCEWLAERGVEYVEQPLAVEADVDLVRLRDRTSMPIFVDESCFTSQDIPRLAPYVSGINIKIMKAGGLTEVMRMVQIAKACDLKVMYGCYSDSTLANTAMSHLAPLADYLDLDSHLNLIDDPFRGAILEQGCMVPNDLPGLGVISVISHH